MYLGIVCINGAGRVRGESDRMEMEMEMEVKVED